VRRPVRVCFLIDRLGLAGTETQLLGLIARLDRARVEPSLGLLDGEGERSRSLEPADCPVLRLGVRSLLRPATLRPAARLGWWLARGRVDVLQVCAPDSAYLGTLVGRLAGVRRLVQARRSLGYWMTPRDRRLDRLVRRLADATLTNCEAIRREILRDSTPPHKVAVIGNGIDLAPFLAVPALDPDRPGPLRVGAVANLRPVKDVSTFVRAARRLADVHPDVAVAVAGEGDQRPELEGLVGALRLSDRLTLPGAVHDVPGFLAGLRVAVLCSKSEGQSNALIEAMATGRAVVATDVGGNGELVEDGVTGLLVPPGDPDRLAEAIGRLLTDPGLAARLGTAARARVRAHHDWEAVARRFEDFYLGLVGDPLPAPDRPVFYGLRRGDRAPASQGWGGT
jgi:glycosyltransferase involved in cell wall biosynthesis